MTRFVTFLLLTVVFVLACAVALVLFMNVAGFTSTRVPPGNERQLVRRQRPAEEGASWFLTKLNLFPAQRQLVEPVAVIIENHAGARPHQEGLGKALAVQEFLVEGLISRFAVIFDASDLPDTIGPVRSLRPYFIDALVPVVKTIFHAGGSPEAFERLAEDTSITAINGLRYESGSFERSDDVPAPHNLFLSEDGLLDLLEERPERVLWPPMSIGAVGSGAVASTIELNFFNPDHDITYTYNIFTGTYTRVNGDVTSDMHPRNVLILEMPIEEVGEHGRLTISVESKGRVLLFRAGRVIEGRWMKEDADSNFSFEEREGQPLTFAKGQTWMTVLPTLERVSFGPSEISE